MSVSIPIDGTPAAIDEVQEGEGVVKMRLVLSDSQRIETVLLPDENGYSLCVSTQVGCKMGCVFCATGRMGFVRDLVPEEIALQVRAAHALGKKPDKMVFMGMGEPFDNYENWSGGVDLIIESRRRGGEKPRAFGSTRRMTVSTCGHVAGMERFATEGFRRMGFALSLNAPDDEIRSALMPVNKRWNMAALREAVMGLNLRGGVVLVEYVLFGGVNDAPGHAKQLAQYLEPLRALVNILPYNPAPGTPAWLKSPSNDAVTAFQKQLADLGVFVTRRESKGQGLCAACGQLAT